MKKGEIGEILIEGVRFPNKAFGHTGGELVVVKNALPGQKIRFLVAKKRSDKYIGKLLEVSERSPLETRGPLCGAFSKCGGCAYQTLSYEAQLSLKENQVRELLFPVLEAHNAETDIFEKAGHALPLLPYRNKMEYTFGDEYKGGQLVLGLHKKNSNYDIVPCENCAIAGEDMNMIRRAAEEYCREKGLKHYHRGNHTGYLRNLLLRRGERTGEIMAALVTTSEAGHDFSELVSKLLSLKIEGRITGILHMEYDGVADVVRSENTKVLYGREHIFDEINGMRFKISPFSFFQTNTRGAEILYETVREFIGDTKDAEVLDLYCGTGTITQMLSGSAAFATGVEIVPEAVSAAKENASANGIENCAFICGDVLEVLDGIERKPDYIVLDPPRDGVNTKALKKIIDFGAKSIVYVSCKPTSLARDLEALLEGGYEARRARCVDMFPLTSHVETVVLMSRVSNEPRKTGV